MRNYGFKTFMFILVLYFIVYTSAKSYIIFYLIFIKIVDFTSISKNIMINFKDYFYIFHHVEIGKIKKKKSSVQRST